MTAEVAYFPNALPRTPDAPVEIRDSAEIQSDSTGNLATARAGLPTSPTDATDERLLEQLNAGEREALGHLFRRHARTVHNVAYRILRAEAEADDLVQEVFLFIFRKAGLFDPARGSARSWLVQVTYHRAFDRRRYLMSRGFYEEVGIEESVMRAEEPKAMVYSSYDDTIEAAIGQDALRRIEASLSEVQRRVLRLRFLDGYTVDEIGAILGQSPGNVRNHYYRAIEKMRREVFATILQTK
jgi:RNA polymerase sigma-70 factor, ECF subfamily